MNLDSLFRRVFNALGIDKAIAYSSGARVFQAFAGVITVFFLATFLTGDEQGYYYTFASILAIQVLFELGFTGILTQYVAHEVAHLSLENDCEYSGDSIHKSRLAFLIRFCLKWYLVIAIAFFVTVSIIGFVFFSSYGSEGANVQWKEPWILLSLTTSINLFIFPFTAIFNGLGKVKEMSRIVFAQQVIVTISQWLLFACGLKLFVVGIGNIIGIIIWWISVYSTKLGTILRNLLHTPIIEKVDYFKEVFPYQWRIALSWISSYFVFQLFNPVLFATEGPVVAGQMGMTLSVLNAIQALVLSWQNTKVPLYCRLIEMEKYDELDSVFNRTTGQVVGITAVLLLIMLVGVWFVRFVHLDIRGSELGDRFLDLLPLALLVVPYFFNQFVNSWATYLRCHKREPYLITSIAAGVLQCLSVFFLGKAFGLYGIIIGYAVITLVLFPINGHIYYSKKLEWHS